MARIAYVDHSFHRTTQSNAFLPEVLARHGHQVDRFWDDAWKDGQGVAWSEVASYDIVIMFQSYCQPPDAYFKRVHPNVIYIPMLDQFGLCQGPLFNLSGFWEPFQGCKVLNFSNAVHCMTTGFGIASHLVRYYQPIKAVPAPPQQGLHGFFWLRREAELPWKTIRALIADTTFDSLHIHLATDPGTPPPSLPSAEDVARHHVTTSTWFENKADLNAVMARANVYFAPRLEEGIGQSFLEAMGRGQCVVAPDFGTMNEYIVPGVNGLLYDPRNPRPLDFKDAVALGAQGLRGVVEGRARWEDAEAELVRFVLTPSDVFYEGRYQHPPLAPTGDEQGGLRAMAQRFAIFRATRFIWHPVLRLVRSLRGH
ncbi:glycosyltransferase family 4 protein [Variovorax robiniae]|uniref:Glycosyltransferase family 4 protein n=1 Tax=Variovorax robiniae TaxID=1836199 RepID=A0ABU8X520_9BURK